MVARHLPRSIYAVNAGPATTGGQLTEAAAKTAIQNYLDAMRKGNTETVARNTLCGILRRGQGPAIRSGAGAAVQRDVPQAVLPGRVTSIDKMVFLSPNQAQVLFSMQVVPVARGAQKHQEQAIAQLLSQDDHLLVCQYLLRRRVSTESVS